MPYFLFVIWIIDNNFSSEYGVCMEKEKTIEKWKIINKGGSGGALYGLGIIGAAVYYMQHAPTFWIGVLGIIKAVFWPAFVLYRVLELLKM
jgi:hypothetical protein